MTPEQKTAFIQAQTALFLCELEGMRAQNAQQTIVGSSMAHVESSFVELAGRWNSILGYNSIMSFFRD